MEYIFRLIREKGGNFQGNKFSSRIAIEKKKKDIYELSVPHTDMHDAERKRVIRRKLQN